MSYQFASATRCFSQLLKVDSVNATAYYYLGKVQAAKGNVPLALTYFCRLVKIKPGVAHYYKQLASLWTQVGNNAAAGWYYKRAYEANAEDPEVIVHLASNWIRQEMYEKADHIPDLALRQDLMQSQLQLLIVHIRSAYTQEEYRYFSLI